MTPNRQAAVEYARKHWIAWLGRAAPGERFAYHTGLLGEDRNTVVYTTARHNEDGSVEFYREVEPAEPIDTLARLAAEAEAEHLVLLVQYRRGPAEYDYVAVRTSKKVA